jgi:hypothetical protein
LKISKLPPLPNPSHLSHFNTHSFFFPINTSHKPQVDIDKDTDPEENSMTRVAVYGAGLVAVIAGESQAILEVIVAGCGETSSPAPLSADKARSKAKRTGLDFAVVVHCVDEK